MKKIYLFILIFSSHAFVYAQAIRVAILDFENISGITKYDGLGKAMSSMLISDIESNVSPKRLQLVERSQILKILKEQKFQLSGSVNKISAVQAGKILGVKYLLIGDVYILNDQLILNARLTNTETGDIVFSKKQEGKIMGWLALKTNIAKDLATSLSMPFTLPRVKDASLSPAILTTYANAITEKDNDNFEKAESLISTAKEFDSKFAYLDDLRNEVEQLKIRFENLENQLETSVENPIASAINFKKNKDYKNANKYLLIGLKRLNNNNYGKKYIYFRILTENFYLEGDYFKSIAFADSILNFYTYDDNAIYFKSMSLIKINKTDTAISIIKNQLINYYQASSKDEFNKQIKKFEKATNFQFSGININPLFDSPFQISIDGQAEYEGEYFQQGIFNQQLNRYAIMYESLNKTPMQVAEEINLLSIKSKIQLPPNFNVEKPYYLPSSRFDSRKTQGKEFVVAETGQSYFGDYYISYDGKKYSGASPQACPCKLLYTFPEYDQFIKSSVASSSITLESFLEREKVFTLGWYYLIAKNADKSIVQYSKLLEHYAQYLSSYQKFQELSSYDKDAFRMAEINIGHAFLLKKDFTNSSAHYVKSTLNREFNGYNGKTSKEVIIDDWIDLVKKGVFTNKLIEDFKFKANDLFK